MEEIHITYKPNFVTPKEFSANYMRAKIWSTGHVVPDQWIETLYPYSTPVQDIIDAAQKESNVIRIKHEISIEDLTQTPLYYEAHVNLYMPNSKVIREFDAWKMSTNILGDNPWKICMTSRAKEKETLLKKVEFFKQSLDKNYIAHDRFHMEGCVFDSNPDLDKGWI